MRDEKVKIDTEEIIMTGVMAVWSAGGGEWQIDLSKIKFDVVKLLKIIKKCKNAGLIYSLIHGHRRGIINAPKELDAAVSRMYGEYAARSREACMSAAKITAFAKEQKVRCAAGGCFAVMEEIAAFGQLYIDELIFYTDREMNLASLSEIPCRCIVKDKAFFDKYSDGSNLISGSIVDAMREELLPENTEIKELDGGAIISYMLYAEYNDRLNYEPGLPPFRNASIEKLFCNDKLF